MGRDWEGMRNNAGGRPPPGPRASPLNSKRRKRGSQSTPGVRGGVSEKLDELERKYIFTSGGSCSIADMEGEKRHWCALPRTSISPPLLAAGEKLLLCTLR